MTEKHPEGDPSVLGGNVLITEYPTLANFGLGSGDIGPHNREDIDQEIYIEMLEALANGEFNVVVKDKIPVICADGRTRADGTRIDAPSSVGGTNGIAYARKLSDNQSLPEMNEEALISDTVETVMNKGHRASVHDDDHNNPCGCGACAKCQEIFTHIRDDIENISQAASALGVELNDEDLDLIVDNAAKSLDDGFFAEDRSKALQAAKNAGATEEMLVEIHNELAIAVNTVPGTRIDRQAIRERFGAQYDVFVVDVWSFENAASEVNVTGYSAETELTSKSLVVYNIATASILANKSIPVITVSSQD